MVILVNGMMYSEIIETSWKTIGATYHSLLTYPN